MPLDYDEPNGPTITLALTRRPADDPGRRIGSMFVNPGGPGGPGTGVVRAAEFLWTPEVLARFDIIGFDPRGVGASTPLQCFPSNAALDQFLAGTPFFPYRDDQVAPYVETFRRYGQQCLRNGGPILRHMSTADVARDMDLLRQAVGDEGLTYDGVSYGSFLGNVYANLFPDKVRAVVIDGVLDPVAWTTGRPPSGALLPFSMRLGSAHGADGTLDHFLKTCEAAGPARCALAPGARAKFDRLDARAKQAPVPNGPGGEPLTYDLFNAILLGELYDSPAGSSSPRASRRFYDATFSPSAGSPATAALATGGFAYDNGFDAFLAVACADSVNPRDPAAWPRAVAQQAQFAPVFAANWTYASEPCSTWPVVSEDHYLGPFDRVTAAPVLVIGNVPRPGHAVPRRQDGRRAAAPVAPADAERGRAHLLGDESVHRQVRRGLPGQGSPAAGRHGVRPGVPTLHAAGLLGPGRRGDGRSSRPRPDRAGAASRADPGRPVGTKARRGTGRSDGRIGAGARRRRRLAGGSFLAVLAAGVAVVPAEAAPAAPVRVPVLRWTGCGAPYECATARVPLDHDNPGGPTISLALIRLPAGDPARRIGSLFVNPGGPGGSGVELVRGGAAQDDLDAGGAGPLRRGRIRPTRGGRLGAHPVLRHGRGRGRVLRGPPWSSRTGSARSIRSSPTYAEYGGICLRNNGPIMRHLSTANVARDLDLLRRAVGDARLTYDGASYGSFIGSVYANLFPNRVRAMVLDGVIDPVAWTTGRPPNGHTFPFSVRTGDAHGAQAALGQFLTRCDAAGPAACALGAERGSASSTGCSPRPGSSWWAASATT